MHTCQILLRRIESRVMRPLLAARMQRMARSYLIGGRYKRLYHYHVRKTAGTSLNTAFQSLVSAGLPDIAQRHFMIRNDIIFVQHRKYLIEGGNYFFANSHIPAHMLKLPNDTFTITILRDPLERVISHYSHLIWARDEPKAPRLEPAIGRLRREMKWLGSSFGDFVTQLPRPHLLNQLFMFSGSFSVAEAAARIAGCSYVGFTSTFAADIDELARTLDLPLTLSWERRFGNKVTPSAADLQIARDLLLPEYDLMHLVQSRLGTTETVSSISAV